MESIKKYVVLSTCQTVSTLNYDETIRGLYPIIKKTNRCLPHLIELDDGTVLYFSTYESWRRKYGIGKHDVKEVKDYVFLHALLIYVEKLKSEVMY